MTTDDLAMPPTRAVMVAEGLRRLIQAGEIAPGSRLRQNEIAELFGVSTTPVREAFAELARDGTVRQDAHRGVTVFEASLDELVEIYEIRGALEPMATEFAVARATDEELAELEKIVEEMRTAEPERYTELNQVFHGRIYDMSGRPRLAAIVEGLRKTSGNYIKLTLQRDSASYRRQVQAEHEEILAMMRARQCTQAARAVRSHLETTATHVTSLVADRSRQVAACDPAQDGPPASA